MQGIYIVYLLLNSARRNRDGLAGSRSDVGLQRGMWYLRLLLIAALCPVLLAQGALSSPPLERIGIRLASDRIAMDAEVLHRVSAPRREALGTTGGEHRFGLIVKTNTLSPATILQLPGLRGRKVPPGLLASGDGRYEELGRGIGGVVGFVLCLFFCLIATGTRLTAISCSFSDSRVLLDEIAQVLRRRGYGKVAGTEDPWEFQASTWASKFRGYPGVRVEIASPDRAQIVGPFFLIERLKQKLSGTKAEIYTGPQPWGAWAASMVRFAAILCVILLAGAGVFAWFMTHH